MPIVKLGNQPLGHEYDDRYIVQCINCLNKAQKIAVDPGQASENAREEGFASFRPGCIGSPLEWLCPSCKDDKKH